MIILKIILLFSVFGISTFLGYIMANKYKGRLHDLKLILSILNIIETKMKYTYEALPQIFEDISNKYTGGIGNLFKTAKDKMKYLSAGEAWNYAICNSFTFMNEEDIKILNNLDKMLGKTDIEGQLSELELVKKFIETQVNNAEEEKKKNEKLYRSLGMTIGLALVIVLI